MLLVGDGVMAVRHSQQLIPIKRAAVSQSYAAGQRPASVSFHAE